MQCKKCGNEITGNFCPACGTMQAKTRKKIPAWRIIVGIPIALIGFGVVVAALSDMSSGTASPAISSTPTPSPYATPALVVSATTEVQDIQLYKIVNVNEYANVRSAPDPKSDLVFKADRGVLVKMIEVGDEWCNIEMEGQTGYIHSDYITIYDPDNIDYKEQAIEVDYDSIVRTPDKYEGQIIVIKVKILQEMVGGMLTESGYRGVQDNDEWYIPYELPENDERILVGDTVRFYGKFTGLEKMTRTITFTTELIPELEAYEHEIIK